MSVEIRTEGIGVALGGVEVLSDVGVFFRRGERTALVGPNGGGKTTLVRILLGLLPADRGRIRCVGDDGREVRPPRLGYLPQRSSLAPEAPVSGLDLVVLSMTPGPGFSGTASACEEARCALARAGLDPALWTRPVGRLSGGQRQRVLLARALAGSPPFLVLDEPDTALDAEGLKTLRRIVAEEIGRGHGVITVTHDSDAMGGADRIWRIDRTAAEVPVG
ncbi:MAG: metal ABC transporter ATP-binding protein [Acidobacteria bacterium]|nr:MAG: metal ABC transporter ATP-binding protein [Acidobacteriota bacterium]